MKSVWIFVVFSVIFAQSDGQPLQYRMIRRICPSGSYHDPIKDRCRRVPGGGEMLRFNFDARCAGGFEGLLAHSKKSRYYFVCQRYAVLTCRCKRNERFDRFHLECTKSGKKLSKQERKCCAVVDNIVEKFKCLDHSFEVFAPPTTAAPVEETTFDYYDAFRKAIADFNLARSASGSIEDTTFGTPKISWSTEGKITPATKAPTVVEETTTTKAITLIPTTTDCGKDCRLFIGPLSLGPKPTPNPTPRTTTGLDYEEVTEEKSVINDFSVKVPVEQSENTKKVSVNPPTFPDYEEETVNNSNSKPTVELKTILDKILDKLVQRQNTTLEDLKQNHPDKVKDVKERLNNFFNGTKDVESEDFVDYIEQNNTQQAYMEAYYIYEYFDEKEPDKVLWSVDANLTTQIIPLETSTFRSNRTKVTSLDGQPIRGDQEDDKNSDDDLEVEAEDPIEETSTVGILTTTSFDTTTETEKSIQSTTISSSDENSKESTVEIVTFQFPTPENLVTLPSTTFETTSQSVTTTETVPFTSTTASNDAETATSTTFDTSTLISSEAVRFGRESGEFSTMETTETASTTEDGTSSFTTTDYPTTLKAFRADDALSTSTLPEEQTTTVESTIFTMNSKDETSTVIFGDDTTTVTPENETSTVALEEETSTVTSFNDLFSESTTRVNSEEFNENFSNPTTLGYETTTTVDATTTTKNETTTTNNETTTTESSVQETTTALKEEATTTSMPEATTTLMEETTTTEDFNLQPRKKALHLTTTDASTTDFETFSSTFAFADVTTLETTLETTTLASETSSEPSAETSTRENDEFGLTTTEVMKTDAPESTTAEAMRTDAPESTTADSTSETAELLNTTTEILENFRETTTSNEESSTGMPEATSTTDDSDVPTTSTLMPDTPYTDISIETTDSRAVFHLNDTRETFPPTTTEFESTTASVLAPRADPKLEQQPKEASVEYFYVHEDDAALGDPNGNMTAANNSSFTPKRDNSFEYYVESMSASREINSRN